MSKITRIASPGGVLLAVCAVLAGCSTRTDVSATGSTPSQYSHVFITAQEVWFNTSATASPDDTSWVKKPLTTPVTVDLVTQSNGNLGELLSDLQLAPGTYSQIRLIPVDASAPLTTSATTLGALFNEEADYVDSAGTAHQVALEIPNPDKGIGIQASLKVPIGTVGASALGGTSSTTTSSTTPTTASPLGFGTTTATPTTTTGTTSTASTTTTVSFAMSFDGARDIKMFTYGTASGVLLSSAPAAYDLASSGAITGTLTLTSLTALTNPSDRLNIQASAETLSADGSRHVVVATAPVQTDGTFTIYPLPSNSTTPTSYDVVIHGPGIATIIIKSVAVTTTPPTITADDTTTTNTSTTTATTPVSIGTFIPRASTTSYTANVTPTSGATLPGGATMNFYQTLPASGEVPYVIEEAALDPFNFTLGAAEPLPVATIDSGTYVSSGTTITLTSSKPTEGTGTYRVAATAPLFTDGALSSNTAVTAPAAPATTTTTTVPTLTVASGATAASITATVTAASPTKYDKGELIVTHDGAIIGTTPLDSTLAAGGTVTVSGLPGGASGSTFGSALYYLSVRVWNSTDPTGIQSRQWYSSPVSLSNGSATGVAITIN